MGVDDSLRMTGWHYAPRLRPPGGGGMPPGVRWGYVAAPHDGSVNRPDLAISQYRYGSVFTDRELTAEEIERFDLTVTGKGHLTP